MRLPSQFACSLGRFAYCCSSTLCALLLCMCARLQRGFCCILAMQVMTWALAYILPRHCNAVVLPRGLVGLALTGQAFSMAPLRCRAGVGESAPLEARSGSNESSWSEANEHFTPPGMSSAASGGVSCPGESACLCNISTASGAAVESTRLPHSMCTMGKGYFSEVYLLCGGLVQAVCLSLNRPQIACSLTIWPASDSSRGVSCCIVLVTCAFDLSGMASMMHSLHKQRAVLAATSMGRTCIPEKSYH